MPSSRRTFAEKLRALGVDTVITTGYCAEYCVLSTYRGAKDLDFMPLVFRGGLASGHPERIRFVEDISEVVSYGAFRVMLSGA